jgi:CRP/FNR family cyclic AMP-dependent transcriptional regulator
MPEEPGRDAERALPGPIPPAGGDGRGPLQDIPLFGALDEPERQSVFEAMHVERIEANQTVFWRGDGGDSLYLIREGGVSVTVPNEQGEHVVLDRLGPGAFFGEISLLDGGARTATVRAILPTELYVLKREDFHAVLRRDPDVAIGILSVMGRRQRASNEALRGFKNPNVLFEQSRVSWWQRVSDIIAAVAASQWFTLFHLAWFGSWIGINVVASLGFLPERMSFDPFPFGLLTMVVSLEAIFLSIFVMVSQNRQSEKDRVQIDLDYQVNLKAQTEIMTLRHKLDRIERALLDREE